MRTIPPGAFSVRGGTSLNGAATFELPGVDARHSGTVLRDEWSVPSGQSCLPLITADYEPAVITGGLIRFRDGTSIPFLQPFSVAFVVNGLGAMAMDGTFYIIHKGHAEAYGTLRGFPLFGGHTLHLTEEFSNFLYEDSWVLRATYFAPWVCLHMANGVTKVVDANGNRILERPQAWVCQSGLITQPDASQKVAGMGTGASFAGIYTWTDADVALCSGPFFRNALLANSNFTEFFLRDGTDVSSIGGGQIAYAGGVWVLVKSDGSVESSMPNNLLVSNTQRAANLKEPLVWRGLR